MAKAGKAGTPVTKTITLPFSKTTPGTHVYGFEKRDKSALCSQVYLSKEELGETPPDEIEMSVTYKAK